MTPLPSTSGDPIADRRADYAEMLFASGDRAAAVELLLGALELAPGWALGWFRLGELQEAMGAAGPAAEAWRMALKLDPVDRPGAALKLELIGEAPVSTAPPSAFVEALFDQYAGTFDASLVGKLQYRVPSLIFDALALSGPRRYANALDLGSGTGLMGERLRPLVDRLEGQDISAAMLRKAEAKKVYDRLVKSDLQGLSLASRTYDLVTAADVFMYVGALDRVFAAVAAALRPGGVFAFSVERHDGPGEFTLRESRRYAHSEAYLRRLLAACGLPMVSLTAGTIRMDRDAPVEGLVVVAEMPGAG